MRKPTPFKNIKRIKKWIDKSPFFVSDFDERYKPTNLWKSIRIMKEDKEDILFFKHCNNPTQAKCKIPHFAIIFKSNQRKQAWNMLIKRYPEIKKMPEMWTTFGNPILDGLVSYSPITRYNTKQISPKTTLR